MKKFSKKVKKKPQPIRFHYGVMVGGEKEVVSQTKGGRDSGRIKESELEGTLKVNQFKLLPKRRENNRWEREKGRGGGGR